MTDFGWVAAAVAPWTVSPHPNFGVGSLHPYSVAALVTEFRHYEIEKHISRLEDPHPSWSSEVINQITLSTRAETQRDAACSLRELARREDLSPGARTAACLYASVAFVEQDDIESSIRLLTDVLESFQDVSELTAGASFRLTLGVLYLQRALRFYEIGMDTKAVEDLKTIRNILPTQRSHFEEFEVSRGIAWSAQRVQLDVLRVVKSNSTRLKSRLENIEGDTWVQVVRARPGWIDIRTDWMGATRDREYIKDSLQALTQTSTGRETFSTSKASIEAGLAALLVAELSGDIGRIYSNRTELGRIRLLDQESPESIRFSRLEALRLLRHARDKDGLVAALVLGRTEWDATVLADAARVLMDRPSLLMRLTEEDIRVLASSVDLLASEDIPKAIEAVLNYLELPTNSSRKSFAGEDLAFRVLRESMSRVADHELVAARVANILPVSSRVIYSQAQSIESLVTRFDVDSLSEPTKKRWMTWAHDRQADPDLSSLVRAIFRRMSPQTVNGLATTQRDIDLSLELLLSNPSPADVATDLMQRIVDYCRKSLSEIRLEARKSARSVGGIDSGDLAVSIALYGHDDSLWQEIVEFLTDTVVLADSKADAVERLADNIDKVPSKVRESLMRNWSAIESSPRSVGFFANKQLRHFPEAIRLGATLGVSSSTVLLQSITDLASDDLSQSRIEAARSIRAIDTAVEGTSEWALSLLLQLTRDGDPVVRAEAAKSLAVLSATSSSLDLLVDRRLEDLLKETTIRTPLALMHGFQMCKEELAGKTRIVDLILAVSKTHPSATVRGAAQHALNRMGVDAPLN